MRPTPVSRHSLPASLFLFVCFLIPQAAWAASFIVPHDDEMIRDADAIVIATVRDMYPQFATNRDIVTNIGFDVEEVLKSSPGLEPPLRLRELGGIIGEQFMVASGTPVYWPDNRALLFLQRDATGNWRTYGTSLGKFDFVEDDRGNRFAVRWAQQRDVAAWTKDGQRSEEPLRDANRFLAYIRAQQRVRPRGPRLAGETTSDHAAAPISNPTYLVEPAVRDLKAPLPQAGTAVYPPSAYTQGRFRWAVFDSGGFTTFFVSGSQPPYDAVGVAQRGLAAWTNDPGSNVDYRYAGTNSAAFVQDGVNTIVYDNTADVPSGAIAYAKWYGSGQHTYRGETFYSTNEGDVVIKAGISVSPKTFEEAVTHELGHTLGFRHSDAGTPSSTEAVMKTVVSGAYGATLGPWDVEAVRTVYGSLGGSGTSNKDDFDADGISDLVWRNTSTGQNAIWYMRGANPSNTVFITGAASPWDLEAVGDLNADGSSDLLWRNYSTGQNAVWFMDRGSIIATAYISSIPTAWQLSGSADFNGDTYDDLVWRNVSTGDNAIWYMNGSTVTNSVFINGLATSWTLEGTGDFDANGRPDLIWRNYTTGQNAVWYMNDRVLVATAYINSIPVVWNLEATGDFDGNGTTDLVFRNYSTGQNAMWFLVGTSVVNSVFMPSIGTDWRLEGGR